MRILLVEDHEIVRRGVKQLLREVFPDAAFGEADSLPPAREKLARETWDLLLLDINLAGGSGFDLLSEVKKSRPRLPVLVLTAYPEEEFAIRAFRLGASGYLTKGSLADEMLVAVRNVLAGGKYLSAALAERLAEAIGPGHAGAPHETLSSRELEVLRLVASGRSAREIAGSLALSERTIATYRSRIAEKLGVSTNVGLTRYALRHGLVE